jgi:hypothetical protein
MKFLIVAYVVLNLDSTIRVHVSAGRHLCHLILRSRVFVN